MITNSNNDDERHNGENMFLREDGYTTIIQAKAAVDADPQCANKVSCADIMALAARDAVVLVMLINSNELRCATITCYNNNNNNKAFNPNKLG
jgi:Peroxidase